MRLLQCILLLPYAQANNEGHCSDTETEPHHLQKRGGDPEVSKPGTLLTTVPEVPVHETRDSPGRVHSAQRTILSLCQDTARDMTFANDLNLLNGSLQPTIRIELQTIKQGSGTSLAERAMNTIYILKCNSMKTISFF